MSNVEIDFGNPVGKVILPGGRVAANTVIYMAGPLGFAETTRPFYYKLVEFVRGMGADVLDP